RLDPLAEAVLQQGPVAAIGHEADLLALRLQRRDQPKRAGLLADLSLCPVPDWEAEDAQLLLAELVEHIRLVLPIIDRSAQSIAVRAPVDARVVARGQTVGAQRHCLAQQEPELDRLVAPDAGIGRAPLEIRLGDGA